MVQLRELTQTHFPKHTRKAALTSLAVVREDLHKLFEHDKALRMATANLQARLEGQIKSLKAEAQKANALRKDLLFSQVRLELIPIL